MSTKKRIRIVALAVFGFCLAALTAEAIPAWARKYGTSCSTCHVGYPKLNSFGNAFRANGYRMPAGDEDLTKIKDVPLGSEAWKRLWPNGIWPGAIPGNFPFSVAMDFQTNYEEDAEVNPDFAFPQNVQLIGGGTLGDDVGYFAGVTLIEGNEFGGLHRAFGQFDSIKGNKLANFRFGFIEPRAVPFSTHRKLTLSDYFVNVVGFDLNTLSGIEDDEHGDEHGADEHSEGPRSIDIGGGHGHGAADGAFALSNSQRGLEWWGVAEAGGGGGLEYAVGLVNGNGAGNDEGTFDNNGFKDVYWRAAYKIGGMGVLGSMGDDPAEPVQTEGWRDDSVTIGTFGYYGKTPYGLSRLVPRFDEHGEARDEHGEEPGDEHGDEGDEHGDEGDEHGDPGDEHGDEHGEPPIIGVVEELVEGDENFLRVGFDFSWLIGDLNLFGAYMYGRNDRIGFESIKEETDFTTWFVQGDYVFLPWVIGALRYEKADLPEGFLDAERWIPHVTLLIRANVKFVAEGQIWRNNSGRNRGAFNVTFAF